MWGAWGRADKGAPLLLEVILWKKQELGAVSSQHTQQLGIGVPKYRGLDGTMTVHYIWSNVAKETVGWALLSDQEVDTRLSGQKMMAVTLTQPIGESCIVHKGDRVSRRRFKKNEQCAGVNRFSLKLLFKHIHIHERASGEVV